MFVITDHFTKYTEAFPTPNQTAETAARIIVEEIVIKYGSPSEILSDQGSQFAAEVSNHPQSNGQTERFNRTLASMLRPYVNAKQTDWDEYIRYVLYAYYLMFGRKPRTSITAMYSTILKEMEGITEKQGARLYDNKIIDRYHFAIQQAL